MSVAPAAPLSLVDRIASAVRERVQSGAYGAGHHLVEADLTSEFGASRGPVREALLKLVAEGLLVKEHNRGIRVRQLEPDELRSLYEVREMLEGLAARLAAAHLAQRAHRTELRNILARMNEAARVLDVDGYYRLNEELHDFIVRISGNSYVQGMVGHLRVPAMRSLLRAPNAVERTRRSHRDHVKIIEALLAGDPAAAERAMRQHIRASAEFVSSTTGEPPRRAHG